MSGWLPPAGHRIFNVRQETRAALDSLEAIAATEGVDGVFPDPALASEILAIVETFQAVS